MNQKFIKSPKLEKWLKAMQTIQDEIIPLLSHVKVFGEVQNIIRLNSHTQKHNYFYRCFEQFYFSHALVGLRRQIKPQKDSISFVGLLEDIAENPTELSFSYYLSIRNSESDFQCFQRSGVPFSYREMIEEEFKRYSDPNCEYVCSRKVTADVDKLKKVTKACVDFADKRVAHRDKREPKVVPTYNQLDNCIKLLDEIYVKYHLLFYAVGMTTLYAEFQYDWKVPFREPWLVPHSG